MIDMKRNIRIAAFSIVFLLTAACSPTGIGGATPTRTPRPTDTERPTQTGTPTPTVTVDPASIPTALPMVTPSPGPAPDLEVFNVTIEKNSEVSTMFMAEIRNNSDEPMIFPSEERALRLRFDVWYEDLYRINDVFIKPNIDYKEMNCILYPQEKGIVTFNLQQKCSGGDCHVINDVKLNELPEQMGYRLNSYEGFYRRWTDYAALPWYKDYFPNGFYKDFHLPVENVKYKVKPSGNETDDVEIIFNFDFSYSDSKYKPVGYIQAWIILYDNNSRIINVLRKDYNSKDFCEREMGEDCPTGKYPIRAVAAEYKYWDANDGETNWWFKPLAPLTMDDSQRLDHLQVFIEYQSKRICDHPVFG
jgi:hypothetical protein